MTEQEALELDGYRKSYDLLLKGMERQAELMDGLKQETREQAAGISAAGMAFDTEHRLRLEAEELTRTQAAELGRLRALAARLAEALAPFVPHPDIDCGNDDVHGRAQSALADARAAGPPQPDYKALAVRLVAALQAQQAETHECCAGPPAVGYHTEQTWDATAGVLADARAAGLTKETT